MEEQYRLFIENIRKTPLTIMSGDFRCPEGRHGVVAVWDTRACTLWFQISTAAPWDKYSPDDEAMQWCIRQGVASCPDEEAALSVLEQASGNSMIGF